MTRRSRSQGALGQLVWHALLVKRHKISPHPEIPVPEVESPEPFSAHLKRVADFGLVLLGVLSVLGVLVPPVVRLRGPATLGHRPAPPAARPPAVPGSLAERGVTVQRHAEPDRDLRRVLMVAP
ncbi:hypothetical protein OH738_36175 [Streptomyces hirsutus]|uniref:Uncharacterized protein n=1 Tax=Streptomyces hirsutus TaxID=35620 RepID=A0ABZ1GI12_9ACTN|nr:hypothetical protein [Streptomyces hirsutus]WSD04956.1 hypothetical protein OIE73_03740 [Streptomyces hirsutus]WTD21652.1 hypothetical protein OH738_36175 [Streptomyces hirsutus]